MTSFYFPFVLAVGGMLFLSSRAKIHSERNESVPCDDHRVRSRNRFVLRLCARLPGQEIFNRVGRDSTGQFSFWRCRRQYRVGFSVAYRAGWKLGVAAVATNVAVTAMLIPIGILVFKDHLSLRNILGLIFCVLGLVLVARD